jgi:hypothetical protein
MRDIPVPRALSYNTSSNHYKDVSRGLHRVPFRASLKNITLEMLKFQCSAGMRFQLANGTESLTYIDETSVGTDFQVGQLDWCLLT